MKSPFRYLSLPAALVRLYHLEVLDLQGWMGSFDLKGHISNLVKLRHFLVPVDERHTGIFEVGKLEFLQELRKFNVTNEKGFELSQLGKLTEPRFSLSEIKIYRMSWIKRISKIYRKYRIKFKKI
jgi:hypothetical protein